MSYGEEKDVYLTSPIISFVNLSPHPITIQRDENKSFTIKPSGILARVSSEVTLQGYADGIQVYQNHWGEIENLPKPAKDTFYIVSSLVLNQTNRKDVLAPDTGPTCIRDDQGHIQAVTQFITNTKWRDNCAMCGCPTPLEQLCQEGELKGLCPSCEEGFHEE